MDVLEQHHLGLACRSIENDWAIFRQAGARAGGPTFEDPDQGVRGRFIELGTTRFELLENLDGSRVLVPWLRGGSRVYHVGYLCDDLDLQLRMHVEAGAKIVRDPATARAFDGRRIAFVMLPNLLLIELIER